MVTLCTQANIQQMIAGQRFPATNNRPAATCRAWSRPHCSFYLSPFQFVICHFTSDMGKRWIRLTLIDRLHSANKTVSCFLFKTLMLGSVIWYIGHNSADIWIPVQVWWVGGAKIARRYNQRLWRPYHFVLTIVSKDWERAIIISYIIVCSGGLDYVRWIDWKIANALRLLPPPR